MARPPRDGDTQSRLFTADPFNGFGPTRFRPADEPVTARKLRSKRATCLRRGVRDHAPRVPGVYGMLDDRGRVIYIGKAKSLRVRLLSYFRENSRDPKAGKILGHTRCLVWEQTGDEFAALLRELELIQHFRPRFNVLSQPGMQRYHYLCLGKSPAPYLFLAGKPTGKELGVYGPFVSRFHSDEAARRLNDWFRLRDCPQTVPLMFADQPELFPENRSPGCLRFELNMCTAPCVGACTRSEYGEGVRRVKAFLDGRDRTVLTELRRKMDEAAGTFQFEKAAALRDRLQILERLDDRLKLLRKARNRNSFVYPLAGADGVERWYLIHHGQVRAVVPAPQSDDARKLVAAVIAATFTSTPQPGILAGGAVDSVLLVASWFGRNAGEKKKLLTHAAAIKMCQYDC